MWDLEDQGRREFDETKRNADGRVTAVDRFVDVSFGGRLRAGDFAGGAVGASNFAAIWRVDVCNAGGGRTASGIFRQPAGWADCVDDARAAHEAGMARHRHYQAGQLLLPFYADGAGCAGDFLNYFFGARIGESAMGANEIATNVWRSALLAIDFLVGAGGGFDAVDVNGGKTAGRGFAIASGFCAAQRTVQGNWADGQNFRYGRIGFRHDVHFCTAGTGIDSMPKECLRVQ